MPSLGITTFLPETARNATAKLDWFGFGALSLTIAALQVMLDRGEQLDWFGSGEIVVEAIIGASAFYLFLVHTFTAPAPFVRPSLFRDRNFTAGIIFIAIIGLTYYASLALQPPYLQNLMNYPIVTAGLVLGPRGVGTMGAMLVVGKLIGKVDTRALLGAGLGLTAWSFYAMTGWTPDVSQMTIINVGVIQGIGLGFLFVPLSVVTLSTLSSELRAEGAGLYSLSRNIGSSVGISVVNSLLTTNTQVNHAEIAQHVTAVNRIFSDPTIAQVLESPDRRRTRRARRHDHPAGADHRLHRRLQAVDDRDDRRAPAAHCLQEGVRRGRPGSHGGDGINDRPSMAPSRSERYAPRRRRSPRWGVGSPPIR